MTKQLSEQLLLASKKLNKSKDMLEQFKKDYPTASSDIQYLENQISKLEEKYENLTKNKDKDWDTIQENYIKKVYAVDKYFSNWILFQRSCVLVYGEEMTRPEKIEREIKDERIKKKKDTFWDKKKKKKDAKFWQYDFWF